MSKLNIPEEQIIARLGVDNPWWQEERIPEFYQQFSHRLYFSQLNALNREKQPNRAVVLMGPRRVGKTVIIYHLIQELIRTGADPRKIIYLSLDTPVYSAESLESLFNICRKANGLSKISEGFYVFYDEVQYLKEWEVHLKSMVDTYHGVKFFASGSAAAALKLKSRESGAGRFTDFSLPPLTFHEFIHLRGAKHLIRSVSDEWQGKAFTRYETVSIEDLNKEFISYLNFGGYPEVSLSERIQSDPARYLKSDIIDKVLQRDLPTLYGIQDVRELSRLFTTIAFNTGNEFSYESLAQTSGVSSNTIRKYINYLEAAFLIKIVHRIGETGKKFKRVSTFKIYLTNSSIRSGLFAPLKDEDERMGNLVETGVFAQWFHRSNFTTYYARWARGEVDIVSLNKAEQKPSWAVEVKWSDAYADKPQKLKSLLTFATKNKLSSVVVTSKTRTETVIHQGIELRFVPAALYCYTVGRRSVEG
jgi:predicted AAA+ superfamily ATPase